MTPIRHCVAELSLSGGEALVVHSCGGRGVKRWPIERVRPTSGVARHRDLRRRRLTGVRWKEGLNLAARDEDRLPERSTSPYKPVARDIQLGFDRMGEIPGFLDLQTRVVPSHSFELPGASWNLKR